MQPRNVNLFVDDSDQDVSDIDKGQMEDMGKSDLGDYMGLNGYARFWNLKFMFGFRIEEGRKFRKYFWNENWAASS